MHLFNNKLKFLFLASFLMLLTSAPLAFASDLYIHGGTIEVNDSTLIVPGTITNEGTLSFGTMGTGAIKLSKDWHNKGTFISGIGKVEFIGESGSVQNIKGESSFYSFKCTQEGLTLNFEPGKIQTIEASFSVSGESGSEILLRSMEDGEQWFINPQGSNPGNKVFYVDVKDSVNLNSYIINPKASKDSGSNTRWFPELGYINLFIERAS